MELHLTALLAVGGMVPAFMAAAVSLLRALYQKG